MSQMNTPQVSSDFDMPSAPPAWPKVVGIISIVLASLGLVCGVCGLIQNGMAFAQGGAEMQMPEGKTMQMPAPSLLSIVLMALGWLWSLMLLTAGIMTVKRRANGRTLHIVYAGVSVFVGIASLIVSWMDAQRTIEALSSEPNLAQMAGFIKMMVFLFMCIGAVFGLGYPIFCLIWFGMLGKRPEAGAAVEEPIV